MNGLRVLFVAPGDGRGSSMIFVRRQAESLEREGVEVESFYLGSRTAPLQLARDFRRLRAHIARFQPALVHAHFGTVTAAFAALAARGLPLVITYRGGDLNGPVLGKTLGKFRHSAAHLLSQLAALAAARIVCVSRPVAERLWWRRKRVAILASGVDGDLFQPEPQAAARGRIGWDASQRVVLFNAGHDPRNKRLDLAEQSMAAARRLGPKRLGAELRLYILDGGVAPQLIPTYMNASDCLLITSDQEGSPTVLQEALACGLPVVTVDAGDAAVRLRGVRPSRVVSRDPEVIGRALQEIAQAGMRSNGRMAAERVSLRRLAPALCRVYRKALGRKSLVSAMSRSARSV